MVEADWILAIASIALVGATGALVYATWRLAAFTRAFSKATEEVARTDARRTRMEHRRARLESARERVVLGEAFIRMKPKDWLPSLESGGFPEDEARKIRALALLIDYEKAANIPKLTMDGILSIVDRSGLGTRYRDTPAKNFVENFELIQERIVGGISMWRQEVVDMLAEERAEESVARDVRPKSGT